MKKDYLEKTDAALMRLYKDGDAMAFEVIYNRHKDRVYTYLNRRLHDSQVVEDVFQSVFIKFHKSRDSYSEEHPLLAWLYTITRSVTLDHLKKKKLDASEYIDEN
ncbi:MAG: sigma-70 family RNA polymerase sigma factor, partial [Bdellovibrionota bacterium]|nr:sigma-70 family RNA polymerase sigma factor [Bdellovibrionota bacterium]